MQGKLRVGIQQMLSWIEIGDCLIKGEKGLRRDRVRRILVDRVGLIYGFNVSEKVMTEITIHYK